MPQPDGPISETNSPGWSSRSMSWSAVVPPFAKVLVTFSIVTAAAVLIRHVLRGGADDEALGQDDGAEEEDPERGGDDVRRPQRGRVERVVLVEVDDRASEAVLDRGWELADDRTDDARGRRDLQRREDVGQRRGELTFQSTFQGDAA